MDTLHLLGTGAALTDAHRTTTMLAVRSRGRTLLVDCGGDVIQRTLAAGIPLDEIEGLIISHEHPDHVSGFPLFMLKILLAGRSRPIPVYGIRDALDQARRSLGAFNTDGWRMPEVQWNTISCEPGSVVIDDATWRIVSAPGSHGAPVAGFRFEFKKSGAVLVYSCDTQPVETITELCRNADILVHEATGALPGHSTILEAARTAELARAGRLILVHLPPDPSLEELKDARRIFSSIRFGEELECVAIPKRESIEMR